MMMAMSVQCHSCGIFIYKGTKFNMRKEDVLGENYLGLQIYRFYFRCPQCASEITFKTDPKKSDYVVEHGAHRTSEPMKFQNESSTEQVEEHDDSAKKAQSNWPCEVMVEVDNKDDLTY